MVTIDTSRRLPVRSVLSDIDAFHGLSVIDNYVTGRPEASRDTLQSAYAEMVAAQEKETVMLAQAKAASDAARQTEWQFHNSVLAMKESVRGQFGSDSDEAQAVGYKKKSERKRPRRPAA